MKVGIIGIGLIGGSLAKSIRSSNFATELIGFDENKEHEKSAVTLNLVDHCLPLKELTRVCDILLLTIPVNFAKDLLIQLLNELKEDQVVIDFGSTKSGICEAANNHPNRSLFVASHPIAGTENTGPTAAIDDLFTGKVSIICEKEKSGIKALLTAEKLFQILEMKVLFMDPEEHDRHIAYVSHLSHISSFVLGKTVLEIEKDEQNIFNMAGSGFASTVRLAKSSPNMWTPIFEQNAEHLSKALDAYIQNLQEFKQFLDQKDLSKMHELMSKTNEIRRVLEGIE